MGFAKGKSGPLSFVSETRGKCQLSVKFQRICQLSVNPSQTLNLASTRSSDIDLPTLKVAGQGEQGSENVKVFFSSPVRATPSSGQLERKRKEVKFRGIAKINWSPSRAHLRTSKFERKQIKVQPQSESLLQIIGLRVFSMQFHGNCLISSGWGVCVLSFSSHHLIFR